MANCHGLITGATRKGKTVTAMGALLLERQRKGDQGILGEMLEQVGKSTKRQMGRKSSGNRVLVPNKEACET